MRAGTLAIAAAAVLSFAGCTGGGSSTAEFDGEEKDVAEAVEDLQRGAQRREADDICRTLLATEFRQEIEAGGAKCGAEMKLAIEDVDEFEVEVQDVTITGDRATAKVRTEDADDDKSRTFELVKQGADWRIASFGG